jgi:hypothetical protein
MLIHVARTLDTLRDGVAVFGDGRLRLHNRAFAAIWRLSPALLGGEPHIDDIIFACRPLYDDARIGHGMRSPPSSPSAAPMRASSIDPTARSSLALRCRYPMAARS